MDLASKRRVQAAREHAEEALWLSRATRERARTEVDAWRRWKVRWHELDQTPAGERTLVVCAICHRYRDGRARWQGMPLGLGGMLGSARGFCVSHGLCSACTSRALREVKHLPFPALAIALAVHD